MNSHPLTSEGSATLKLSKTQAELLDAMRTGVTCYYMPYMGRFNPRAYYTRSDSHKRCTAAAAALLEKGLVEKYDVSFRGYRLRAKVGGAA